MRLAHSTELAICAQSHGFCASIGDHRAARSLGSADDRLYRSATGSGGKLKC
jgi:hypothetical protein